MATRIRRNFSRAARSGARRNKLWVSSDNAATGTGVLAGAGTWGSVTDIGDLLSNGETEIGHNFYDITVVRIRGIIHADPPSDNVDYEGYYSVGIGWFPEGISTFPSPAEDSYDWLYQSFGYIRQLGKAGTDQTTITQDGIHWDVDNKSMRKQREQHSTLRLVAQGNLSSAATFGVSYALRTLVMLP